MSLCQPPTSMKMKGCGERKREKGKERKSEREKKGGEVRARLLISFSPPTLRKAPCPTDPTGITLGMLKTTVRRQLAPPSVGPYGRPTHNDSDTQTRKWDNPGTQHARTHAHIADTLLTCHSPLMQIPQLTPSSLPGKKKTLLFTQLKKQSYRGFLRKTACIFSLLKGHNLLIAGHYLTLNIKRWRMEQWLKLGTTSICENISTGGLITRGHLLGDHTACADQQYRHALASTCCM